MSVASLVPLLDVDDESDLRSNIRLYADCPTVIGQNEVAGMTLQQNFPQELLKVEWRDGVLYATALNDNHKVQIQDRQLHGETVLHHGDTLSLWNNEFSYQVRYSERITGSSELSSMAKRKLTDHVTCAVCMELLVSSLIIVPCGHRFCHDCCIAARECPLCRSVVKSRIQDKCLDSLVLELVQERCLDADDSATYLNRTAEKVRFAFRVFVLSCLEPNLPSSPILMVLASLATTQTFSKSSMEVSQTTSRKRRRKGFTVHSPKDVELICLS